MNDIDIINGIKEQKKDALNDLIVLHSRLIYGVIKSILSESYEKEYIEECYDDVILIVWFKIKDFDLERGKFKNWIISIAKFKALDYKRKIKRNAEEYDFDMGSIEDKDELEGIVLKGEERTVIEGSINKLVGIDKEIFRLRYIDEKSIEEISSIIGVTSNVIYTRISRGKRKLKKYMEGYYE